MILVLFGFVLLEIEFCLMGIELPEEVLVSLQKAAQ